MKPASLVLTLASLLLCAAPAPAAAQDEYHHAIRRGDTLIGIGQEMLLRPGDWQQLQTLNQVADPYRLHPGSTLRIPLRLMRRGAASGEISAISGEASADGQPARIRQVVASGSVLRTEADSSLSLRLADGSVLTLQPGTEARVKELKAYGNSNYFTHAFDLLSGQLHNLAAKLRGSGPRYEVSTPGATIGVRGTDFRVGVTPGVATSEVLGGAVDVASGRGRLRLNKGYGTRVTAGATPRAVRLLPAPDLAAAPARVERVLMRVPFAAVRGAHHYRAQLARDADFRQILRESQAAEPVAKFSGPEDGDYWLRVRAVDDQGIEGLDASMAVTLAARPEPPFATAPLRKARGLQPEFSWSENTEASHYRLQWARDAAFTDLLLHDTGIAGPRHAAAAPVSPGRYFWRVASTTAQGREGPWSDPIAFDLLPPPAQPEPPKTDGGMLEFTWAAEPGQRFRLQLARDAAFSDPLQDKEGLTEPGLKLPRPDPGEYFLRVQATDADGFVGPWTAPQRFEVPDDTPWYLMFLLVLL